MRKIAFGYSTRCNVKCAHCVAADPSHKPAKMELARARTLIEQMAGAGISGISFTAGEPLLYLDDILELIGMCRKYEIYSRLVTNSFWAGTQESAESHVLQLKAAGLLQLRLSYSRWHQQNISRENVLNAARSCEAVGLDYFVSFVTDFTEEDDVCEDFLRSHGLRFFAEPMIYSGRAAEFERIPLRTDYQDNCCAMNPYVDPTLDMYACCDAGSHFNRTNFFHLGNLNNSTVDELFQKTENTVLYNAIRQVGISSIASFAGFRTRDIVGYRKCELCEKLFNSKKNLEILQRAAGSGLCGWYR
jgi:MoaA/NifB/PqqE/SkfB family radical SAM enzyme